MSRLSLTPVFALGLLAFLSLPLQGQAPKISGRQYTGGSANVVVTGSFQINQEIPINTAASFSDGEMTWLQFGASGSAEPNSLITYGPNGNGINAAVGKKTVIAEEENCKGGVEVKEKEITGNYECTGVTSYDAATGQMGKVNIRIRFTAKS